MEVVLKPHNIEAYEQVVKGFETKNRVAVVEPPGTGKSFIALKWLEENQDKKTLILVPSYSIIVQYEEHLEACGYQLSDFPNLQIMTYSTLMAQTKERRIPDIEHLVLDEFHRCGAPEWGKGVKALLEKNSNVKVLGLSATPIRYLDNNRDMADELFDGNVVFQMDLTEAVARNILHFPLYITGIYKLDEDIKRYEKGIEKLTDASLKESLNKKLELAKRSLKKATKLEDLFSKYIKRKDGKIILFCKDKNHMSEMIEEAHQWFSKVNPEIDIYSVCYDKKDNEESLREFYNSSNSHLKLLYSIDMLNEGLHVPKIDGIIMLRPTISPILFIQQLGRGLSLDNEDITIYDIVNNVRSSNDIKEFVDRVKVKREKLIREHKINSDQPIGSFEILEEVREVFDILNDIEDMLQSLSSKEHKIELVEDFYKNYGRLPKQLETYKGIAIGTFLSNIKNGRTNLSEVQINRLKKIGFIEDTQNIEEEKEKKVKLVEEFYKENGRLPKRGEIYKNVNLRIFLNSIKYGKANISEQQMNRLISLDFKLKIQNKEEEKEKKIRLIEEFYEKYGRLPKQLETYKEVRLGLFLYTIRQGRVHLSQLQENRLMSLGFKMEIQNKEERKEKIIQLIEEFYRKFGRLPKYTEKYKEELIGRFLNSIKHGNTKVNTKQMERLTKLGFQGQTNDIKVGIKIGQIEKFYKENGRLPEQDESLGREKPKAGEFLLSIRIGKIKITEKQFLRLQQMDATLTREQVKFIEKPKVKVKK